MSCNQTTQNMRGNSTNKKRNATKVMLTFSAPLPNSKSNAVPSIHAQASILGMPFSTLQRIEKNVIKKHRKLTDGKFGVYWAIANRKKGYSTISDKLKRLLIVTFNDHPHVVVSPNSKDKLQLINAEGEKVAVCKILTMVGLGMIFSDIIKENPTIKNRVGEWAFCYLVSGLGCICCFTDSHKTMCGCTECVGLQTMHRSLQVKRGVMHCQIAINLGHCMRKARAEEMARGWGDVGLHPMTTNTIAAGTCA